MDGLSQPKQISARLNELELDACALTDHGTISGSVDFFKTLKNANQKPILGCEFYFSTSPSHIKTAENRKLSHQVILAKNLQGWQDLIRIVSESNNLERFYYKPRIDVNLLSELNTGNLISFSGHLGSTLANVLTQDGSITSQSIKDAEYYARMMSEIFGKDHFFIEIQLIDSLQNKQAAIIGDVLRELAKRLDIPTVATPDAHYCKKTDVEDHRVLLAINIQKPLKEIYKTIKANIDTSLSSFFLSDNYHIPTYEEMKEFHTDEELENTLKITDMCETYNILNAPQLPEYKCPENKQDVEYLRELCRIGWKSLIKLKKTDPDFHVYGDRVKKELEVLKSANLSSYFLIVKDICDYVRSNGWLMSPGRGSSSGCLVSYLLGITSINPLKHNLLFERFYNAGRNTEGHTSYPDIDIDVPKYARNKVINFIKEKYGHDKVAQMITFQTLKGKSALKRVLSAYGELSFAEQNAITQNIVDEHKIADELQEMDDSSIIKWALYNKPKMFQEWCYIDENGDLNGSQASKFAQAIRLENTKVAQSKHPAGIVISSKPLAEVCPMVIDKEDKQMMAALEGPSCEDIGLIKFDILGITMLDKVMGVCDILKNGDIIQT